MVATATGRKLTVRFLQLQSFEWPLSGEADVG